MVLVTVGCCCRLLLLVADVGYWLLMVLVAVCCFC